MESKQKMHYLIQIRKYEGSSTTVTFDDDRTELYYQSPIKASNFTEAKNIASTIFEQQVISKAVSYRDQLMYESTPPEWRYRTLYGHSMVRSYTNPKRSVFLIVNELNYYFQAGYDRVTAIHNQLVDVKKSIANEVTQSKLADNVGPYPSSLESEITNVEQELLEVIEKYQKVSNKLSTYRNELVS